MLVEVTRGGRDSPTIEVPITALQKFKPTRHIPNQKSLRPSFVYPVLCARMWCSSIPEGAAFGHSCLHGPPLHLITVIVKTRQIRTREEARRLTAEANVLADALRLAEDVKSLAGIDGAETAV